MLCQTIANIRVKVVLRVNAALQQTLLLSPPGLDETLVSVSISRISRSKFLVSVSSRSRKMMFENSRSRLGLEITILENSRSRLGLENVFFPISCLVSSLGLFLSISRIFSLSHLWYQIWCHCFFFFQPLGLWRKVLKIVQNRQTVVISSTLSVSSFFHIRSWKALICQCLQTKIILNLKSKSKRIFSKTGNKVTPTRTLLEADCVKNLVLISEHPEHV